MNSIDAERLELAASHLPRQVRAKIDRLIIESSAAWAGLNHANQGVADAHSAWQQYESDNRHRNLFTKVLAADGRPTYESRDAGWLANAAPRLVAHWEAWQRAKVGIPYLQKRWDAYAFLGDLRNWLPENRRFEKHVPVKIKGTNHAEAVEKLREQIAAIDERYGDADFAPCAADDLVARAEIEIDRIAAIGSIRFDPRIRQGSPVGLEMPEQAVKPTYLGLQAEKLVWLFRDEIKAKLTAKIRAETPAETMSDSERASELSALETDKLGLERLEEAHIVAAAEVEMFIARRRDANPLAILEIE